MQRLAWPVLLLHQWWYKQDDKDKDKDKTRPIDRSMRDDYEEEMKPNDSWV